MKRGRILNQMLNEAIASMGHGDILMVVDAGFPIPRNAWRIDLALTQDLPDHKTVLSLLAEDFIVEKVIYGEELEEYNPKLLDVIRSCYPDPKYEAIPHDRIMTEMAARAKAILRTGAFSPFGNICLISGVDAPKWFADPDIKVPEWYKDRAGRR